MSSSKAVSSSELVELVGDFLLLDLLQAKFDVLLEGLLSLVDLHEAEEEPKVSK